MTDRSHLTLFPQPLLKPHPTHSHYIRNNTRNYTIWLTRNPAPVQKNARSQRAKALDREYINKSKLRASRLDALNSLQSSGRDEALLCDAATGAPSSSSPSFPRIPDGPAEVEADLEAGVGTGVDGARPSKQARLTLSTTKQAKTGKKGKKGGVRPSARSAAPTLRRWRRVAGRRMRRAAKRTGIGYTTRGPATFAKRVSGNCTTSTTSCAPSVRN